LSEFNALDDIDMLEAQAAESIDEKEEETRLIR
jgi:hypothetical protein